MPGMSVCENCGEMKLSHRVCKACGTYRGREYGKDKKDNKDSKADKKA